MVVSPFKKEIVGQLGDCVAVLHFHGPAGLDGRKGGLGDDA